MRKTLIAMVAAAVMLGSALPASAKFSSGLISCVFGGNRRVADFKGKAVLGAEKDKWNMLQGSHARDIQVNDTADDLTDVTISYIGDGIFDAGDAGMVGTPWEGLMRQYIHASKPSGVVLNGLTPNMEYDIVVFSASNTNGRRTTFTVGKVSKTTVYSKDQKDLVEGVNYARFTGAADENGKLLIVYGSGGNGGEGNFNGLQITPVQKK